MAERLDRLAFRCLRRDRPADALSYFRRALAVREEAIGEVSFDVANTLTIMAGVLAMHQADQEEAAAFWQRAVDVYEQLHARRDDIGGEDAQNIALGLKGNLENLALHAYDRGRYSEAEIFFLRAMEVLQDQFGAEAWRGICNLEVFSEALTKQGRRDEAERLFKDGD